MKLVIDADVDVRPAFRQKTEKLLVDFWSGGGEEGWEI